MLRFEGGAAVQRWEHLPAWAKRWLFSLIPALLLAAAAVGAASVSRAQLSATSRAVHMLVSGPVLGPPTSTSAIIWVKFAQPVSVQARVSLQPDLEEHTDSPPTTVRVEVDFAGFVSIGSLQPDTQYYYTLVVNGQQMPVTKPYSFRTAPTSGSQFTVVAGGNADDKVQFAWRAMAPLDPSFFISTGSLVNVGQATTLGEVRYAHRSLIENEDVQRFAAQTPLLVTMGIGESGPADAWPRTQRGYQEVWAPVGPLADRTPWQRYQYGDVAFFLLQTHQTRSADSLLGNAQWTWLERELANSSAAFKVLVSEEPFHAWAERFPGDWSRLVDLLRGPSGGEPLRGILLLSGGARRTEAWRLHDGIPGLPALYELVPGRLAVGGGPLPGESCAATAAPNRLFCSDQYSAFASLGFNTSPGSNTVQLHLHDERGTQLFGLMGNRDRIAEEYFFDPHSIPGTFSGLLYDHSQQSFLTHMDSGPGTADWRLQLFRFRIRSGRPEVLSTVQLTDQQGELLSGATLDPEDLALAPDGTLWMVDEFGPWLVQFSPTGQMLKKVIPPARYLRRVPGQGFEGVAVSPDGRFVYALLQSAPTVERDPTRTWLLVYDTSRESFTEHPYTLDDPTKAGFPAGTSAAVGINGITPIGPGEFLVIERDNKAGDEARIKRVYHVRTPDKVGAPVQKSLLVDLLALGYPYEKLEGISMVGPGKFAVINDNDGSPKQTTAVWVLDLASH